MHFTTIKDARELEDISDFRAYDIFPDRYGFIYTKDKDIDDLPDDGIFNVILKEKIWRSLEIKKRWVKFKVSEKEGQYFLIVDDFRKQSINPEVYELTEPVDNKLIKEINKIIFPKKINFIEEGKKIITEHLKMSYKDLIGKNRIIQHERESLIRPSVKITEPFSLTVTLFNKKSKDGTYMLSISVESPNKTLAYSKFIYIKNMSEIPDFLDAQKEIITNNVKNLVKNTSPDDLIF